MTDETIPLLDEDWLIEPETQAASEDAQANFWPFKPNPQGGLPPENRGLDHDWYHKQLEAIEITDIFFEMQKDFDKVHDQLVVRFQYTCIGSDSPAANRVFTQPYKGCFKWNKDRSTWTRPMHRNLGIIHEMLKAAELDVVRDDNTGLEILPRSIAQLKGTRMCGLLFQGAKEKRQQVNGEWSGAGEWDSFQEFRAFKPIDQY